MVGCKKTDLQKGHENSNVKELRSNFFTLPTNASFAVKRVMKELKRQDAMTGFVNNFVINEGLPIWDKVIINEYNTQNIVSSTGDTTLIIPYAIQNMEEIKGYIKAKLNGGIILYLNRASDYIGYSFTQDISTSGKTAVKYALAMMNVNSKTFGGKDYTITDPLLNTAFHPNGTQGNELSVLGPDDVQICYRMRNGNLVDPAIHCITVSTPYWPEIAGSDNTGGTNTSDPPQTGGGAATQPDPCGNKQIVNGNLPLGCGGTQNGYEPDITEDYFTLADIQLFESLNLTQVLWNWIFSPQQINNALKIKNYLVQNNASASAKDLAKKHIIQMKNDPDYLALVNSQASTGDPNKMWWEDQVWLANHFSLSVDRQTINATLAPPNYEEYLLIAIYPIEAYKINKNADKAVIKTIELFGQNSGLNDKADAFRHTYWLAINTKSILSTLSLAFANAHESSTPIQFNLEKQMDLHNNGVGISICGNPAYLSESYLSELALIAVQNGDCRYLSQLLPPPQFPNGTPNPNGDPCYWGCSGNTLGTHGITTLTNLIPTNL